jgi:Ca2+-transporting ATPase
MHVLPVILLWHLVIADAGISSSPVIRLRGGNNPHSDKLKLRDSTAHKLSAEECIHEFHVSESQGLNDQEAAFRLQIAGPNALSDPPKKSTLSLVFEQFEDRLVQILLVVASISAILARFEDESLAFVEPLAIVSILFINAIVGAYQTSSAENALSALKKLQPQKACVLRNGIWNSEFPVAQIVPGDIVYVKVGEKVPADCRILSLRTTTFSTDEGSLTGESVTVSKSPAIVSTNDTAIFNKSNMLFSGTMVANGGCIAMVVNTGLRTEMGLIDASVQAAKGEEHKTPLAEKLDIFGNQLTVIIATICVSVWIVSIPKFSNPVFSSWTKGAVFYAKIAVALAVAAIPEGLPAVITLCLSLGTHRMAKKNVIVRKLKSVETLGCTSVICTDKTGTLTTNQMTGTHMCVNMTI